MHHTSQRPDRGRVAFWAVGLVLALLGATLPGFAQVQTYTDMTGSVFDSSGAAIQGAAVTLLDENTGQVRNVIRNQSGAYSFLSIPPGTYTVTVAFGEFKTAEVTHRVAQVGQPPLGVFVEPGTNNWKFSLQKSFAIPGTEAHHIDFRADLFNAFNHTQWGFVNSLNLASSWLAPSAPVVWAPCIPRGKRNFR